MERCNCPQNPSNWPVHIGEPDVLQVKFNPSNFVYWEYGTDYKKFISHVNEIWKDVECTNFLIWRTFNDLLSILEEEKHVPEVNPKVQICIHTFHSLTYAMYIHLDSIRALINKNKNLMNKAIQQNSGYKSFLKELAIIRNKLIIHREKDDFFPRIGTSWTTDKTGCDIMIVVEDGEKRKTIQLDPRGDAEKMRVLISEILTK